MSNNLIKAVKFLCQMFKIDCSVTNAESFILSIGEDNVSTESLMLEIFEKNFNWNSIDFSSFYSANKIGEDFLEYFSHKIGWKAISGLPLSDEFMIKHKDNLFWVNIARKQKLSEKMMELFKDNLDWKLLSFNQVMSEGFMDRNSSKLDWQNISLTKNLSKEFIERHKDKLNMTYVRMENKDSFINTVRGMY